MAGGFFTYKVVTLIVLAIVLFVASISDIRSRVVDDELTVLLLVIAAFQVPQIGMGNVLLGAFVAAVPFLVPALATRCSAIGGADVKIAFGIGAALGIEKGCMAILTGLLVAVVVEVMKALLLHLTGNENFMETIRKGFPLVPYLAVTAIAIYIV